VPGVYRSTFGQYTEQDRLNTEQHLNQEFTVMSAGLRSGRESVEEIYFLQQHYRMPPTRLLDWTTSALAGLYFACCGKPEDLRRDPLEVRKATLVSVVAKAGPGMRFNEHIEGHGPTVFAHACKLGLEGNMSNGRTYRSGRSPDWLKMKNPSAAAVTREAEEDWGKKEWR
jgi:hypothetical protein